jgi:uncharacterized SAM-binding protein YcdF (DUF218 family)
MARATRPSFNRFLRQLVAVMFVGWLACLGCIVYWARRSEAGPADAIVVLGAAQYGGRPSPVLRSRLDHALALWKGKQAPRVVVTGGRRPGDVISEAAAGRRYLARRGVPTQSILLEPAGRTSLASMQGAAELLVALRDSLHPGRAPTPSTRPRVLLVSDPFHMLRLDILARLHGLQPLPSPTRTSPISTNPAVLEYMLRESIALPADLALMLWLKLTGARVIMVSEGG